MKLPFGLKQKPLPHYIEHGLIKFNIREGTMYYTVRMIKKPNKTYSGINALLIKGDVRNSLHLEQLLKYKSINEIQTIEEVVS